MKTKYVIFEQNGLEVPYLFSHVITHAEFAQQISGKVISAGFCAPMCKEDGVVSYVVYGNSYSLKVSSRPEDERIINQMLLDW